MLLKVFSLLIHLYFSYTFSVIFSFVSFENISRQFEQFFDTSIINLLTIKEALFKIVFP